MLYPWGSEKSSGDSCPAEHFEGHCHFKCCCWLACQRTAVSMFCEHDRCLSVVSVTVRSSVFSRGSAWYDAYISLYANIYATFRMDLCTLRNKARGLCFCNTDREIVPAWRHISIDGIQIWDNNAHTAHIIIYTYIYIQPLPTDFENMLC